MRISLVAAGLSPRYRPRFLDSLVDQHHRNFEMLLHEHGDAPGAVNLLESYPDLDARVVADGDVPPSRNGALKQIDGDVVGFPCDSCWYTPGTLLRVSHLFQADPTLAVVFGRVMTPSGPLLRYPRRATEVTSRNVWRTVSFPGMFVRRGAVEQAGGFDEDLRVEGGHLSPSGEEADYVLRALGLGLKTIYDPLLAVFHPGADEAFDGTDSTGYQLGYGIGVVLRRYSFPPRVVLTSVAQPVIGAAVARMAGNSDLSSYRRAVARGKVRGLMTTQS